MSEDAFDKFKLENKFELIGNIPEDRTLFYDLAKQNITYQSRQENRDWQKEHFGRITETTGAYIIGAENYASESGSIQKYVYSLKVVINKGIYEEVGNNTGENFLDLIPYMVEHEIYEAWLTAKKGSATNLTVEEKHLLARRREFYLAAQKGLGDKVYRFHMIINPALENEYRDALAYAKRRLKGEDKS